MEVINNVRMQLDSYTPLEPPVGKLASAADVLTFVEAMTKAKVTS